MLVKKAISVLDKWKDDVRVTYPTKSSKTGLSDRFTSDYMIGRVAVGIVIMEGNGDRSVIGRHMKGALHKEV